MLWKSAILNHFQILADFYFQMGAFSRKKFQIFFWNWQFSKFWFLKRSLGSCEVPLPLIILIFVFQGHLQEFVQEFILHCKNLWNRKVAELIYQRISKIYFKRLNFHKSQNNTHKCWVRGWFQMSSSYFRKIHFLVVLL